MRAFVTGATGFVGINLVRELVSEGWDVVALHRRESDLTYVTLPGVSFAEGDVTDIESLHRGMPEKVDVVFHVAGDTTLWGRHRSRQAAVNVDGSRNVAAVALRKGATFVQTSSIAAFGTHSGTIDEETPSIALRSPINYVRTKRLAELEIDHAITLGLDAVFVNPANIVGPFDVANWSRLVRMVHAGMLPGAPPGKASWVHVRAVARAHLAAADRGRTGHRYLLGGSDATYLDAIRTIGEITGRRVPDKAMNPMLLKAAALASEAASLVTGKEPDLTVDGARMVCRSVVCDCSKAEKELGLQRSSLREMFGDACEWLRSVGLMGEEG
jgi:nucleoside-diphosphate-sugar epimerase